MTIPVSHTGDVWSFGEMTFSHPVHACSICFCHTGNGFYAAYNAEVFANGKPIGVGSLSEKKGSCLTARFAVDSVVGTYDITVQTPFATLLSISFDAEPICPEEPRLSPADPVDIGAPYLEATDMLGRDVISAEETRGEKKREVGIFYWTWRDAHAHFRTLSVSEVLAKYPAAEYNKAHPAWGEGPFHPHWHEPLFGYYRNDDPYVIRKHAIMLATAGVDFVLLDCTNGSLLWRDAYEALMQGFREALLDGIRAPKVAFMLNFGPIKNTEYMLRALYQELYRPGKYAELWYYLDGKPMIMAYPEALPETGVCESDTAVLNEIRNFFTFRRGQPMYEGGCPQGARPSWGWLENYPQNRYNIRSDGGCEMMTVGVAQNSSKHRLCTYFNDKDTFGRSYTAKDGHALLSADSYQYGYNFAEQWERAIALDPDIVFVTGWNEWIMGQFREPWIQDPDSTQLAMVDQFDREHSRDIEPDKDGYLDTYYLQLCHYIRRYKGSRPRPMPSEPVELTLSSPLSAWESVLPDYRSDRGSQIKRDWDGFAGNHYRNTGGRNNVIRAKVARNAEKLWFYVQTAEPLGKPSEKGWMSLYLATDREGGWEGFNYLLNRFAPIDGKTAVYRHRKGSRFVWDQVGWAGVCVQQNTLVLEVDRALIDLPFGKPLDFRFKWCDGNLLAEEPSIMDVYLNGDTAPFGRFCFRYAEPEAFSTCRHS